MPEIEKHNDGVELFYAPDRAAWRDWLQENCKTRKAVWLVYYKKQSGKPSVSYDEAVEEALCFGWIDSKLNKLDKSRLIQYFSSRKLKSAWSKSNKVRVERLAAESRMAPEGLAKIETARSNGAWNALDDVEALVVPNDLQASLETEPEALRHFTAFPRSSKKNILEWIQNARKVATRAKRIEQTVGMAKENLRANHYRQ